MTKLYKIRKNAKVESLNSTGDQTIGGAFSVTGDVVQAGDLKLNGEANHLEGSVVSNRWIHEEDFSNISTAGLAGIYKTSVVTGLGTNVISGGKNLLTAGVVLNDKESTTLNETTGPFLRAQSPRFYAKFQMSDVALLEVLLGFLNAGSDTVAVVLDTATSPNLAVRLDDGTSEDIDTGIPAVAATDYEIDISIAVDGTPTVKIDGVAIDLSSSTKKMTANAHNMVYSVETLVITAPKTLLVDKFRMSQDIQ